MGEAKRETPERRRDEPCVCSAGTKYRRRVDQDDALLHPPLSTTAAALLPKRLQVAASLAFLTTFCAAISATACSVPKRTCCLLIADVR